ncbi:hypothetical protein PPERSA_06328 [Pseudocohnilembus persalinus]|uniref:Uncharacterized protein n=1 Tax=Pseudocohnilembus persalinus TaxID=266149 RepID=A0A0V0QJA1_PSEPJ|nr:hypothetical protein PPERSA_06328 [Pseudocohnilembus persalinus]|eukprot:KRX02133.1 hypothetical protein PPERSA_06328 [Pseudocohnilembus persalinus]
MGNQQGQIIEQEYYTNSSTNIHNSKGKQKTFQQIHQQQSDKNNQLTRKNQKIERKNQNYKNNFPQILPNEQFNYYQYHGSIPNDIHQAKTVSIDKQFNKVQNNLQQKNQKNLMDYEEQEENVEIQYNQKDIPFTKPYEMLTQSNIINGSFSTRNYSDSKNNTTDNNINYNIKNNTSLTTRENSNYSDFKGENYEYNNNNKRLKDSQSLTISLEKYQKGFKQFKNQQGEGLVNTGNNRLMNVKLFYNGENCEKIFDKATSKWLYTSSQSLKESLRIISSSQIHYSQKSQFLKDLINSEQNANSQMSVAQCNIFTDMLGKDKFQGQYEVVSIEHDQKDEKNQLYTNLKFKLSQELVEEFQKECKNLNEQNAAQYIQKNPMYQNEGSQKICQDFLINYYGDYDTEDEDNIQIGNYEQLDDYQQEQQNTQLQYQDLNQIQEHKQNNVYDFIGDDDNEQDQGQQNIQDDNIQIENNVQNLSIQEGGSAQVGEIIIE